MSALHIFDETSPISQQLMHLHQTLNIYRIHILFTSIVRVRNATNITGCTTTSYWDMLEAGKETCRSSFCVVTLLQLKYVTLKKNTG